MTDTAASPTAIPAAFTPGQGRPLTILIAALGGEGGGLLADWIIGAAMAQGVLVQSTSIPGVAQRTGATTYYLELMQPAHDTDREPVFGLYPAPGFLDLVVASELLEAGRAIENGFVTPDRTTLIASSHRVFAMSEKTAPGSGEYEGKRVIEAAHSLARKAVLADLRAFSLENGVALNAVLLGIIVSTGQCPIDVELFRETIRTRGVAVENNLRGFDLGLNGIPESHVQPDDKEPETVLTGVASLDERLAALPETVAEMAIEGARRTLDHQDEAYTTLYLDRIEQVLERDRAGYTSGGVTREFALTREVARYLALWMAYEDVIRVADLKRRAGRIDRVRRETEAKPHEPVRVTEFMKPGVEELATVLPSALGRRLVAWAQRRGIQDRLRIPMHLRTDTITGYLRLRLVAGLRRMRRRGLRYAQEQALIEKWLEYVLKSVQLDYRFACGVAECGRLIKGYGDTRERAGWKFNQIGAHIIAPALDGAIDAGAAAEFLERANEAALADEEGAALTTVLEELRQGSAEPSPGSATGRSVGMEAAE